MVRIYPVGAHHASASYEEVFITILVKIIRGDHGNILVARWKFYGRTCKPAFAIIFIDPGNVVLLCSGFISSGSHQKVEISIPVDICECCGSVFQIGILLQGRLRQWNYFSVGLVPVDHSRLSGSTTDKEVFVPVIIDVAYSQRRPFLGEFGIDQSFIIKVIVGILLMSGQLQAFDLLQ